MAKKRPKKQKLKRLSLKPLNLATALKLALSTSLDDLKKVEADEKRRK
ncbi:MAG TPA: hypothetical protein VHD56_01520 [Tepidisphaeraceae bacterium]|nr:hypothetical protein [Tepidisphaeraceae bacterium]